MPQRGAWRSPAPRRACLGEPPGECVLLAGVVAAEQRHRPAVGPGQLRRRPVAEARLRAGEGPPRLAGDPQCRAPSDPAQRQQHLDLGHEGDLAGEPRCAGGALTGRRLVGGRGATHGCAHARPDESLPVTGRRRGGGRRQARPVESRPQPVPGAIPCEHTAGAVRPVGRGCQPDDVDAGIRRSNARHRSTPVRLVGEGGATAGPGHLLTPGHEAVAGTAHRDPGVERGQVRRCTGQTCHIGGRSGHRRGGGGGIVGPSGPGRDRGIEERSGDGVRIGHVPIVYTGRATWFRLLSSVRSRTTHREEDAPYGPTARRIPLGSETKPA